MKYLHVRLKPLSFAIAGVLLGASSSIPGIVQGHVAIDESGRGLGPVAASADHAKEAKYVVRFKELPLALYDGRVSGLASAPRITKPGHRTKLDTHSQAALAYVSYLRSQQNQHVGEINSLLGRSLGVERKMQHALNAVVVTLTADEAKKIVALDGVAGVWREQYQQLTTDIGPGFIGAADIWWGASAGVDTFFAAGFDDTQQYRGEGIVVADVDTGYNSNSPSFAGTDDTGYSFINPLGNGNYLGLCNPSFAEQPSAIYTVAFAGCNDKVIGTYDMVDPYLGGPWTFSAEDYQGHGSHTGSTAAGNARTAVIGAYTARISGVAPHANMIVYYSCRSAGCPTTATVGAVDQAIQDGVVDSLNYSISGGDDPWNDPTSLAFLSAEDAGIFVAAAAGNTTTAIPVAVPGTADHLEPWVTTVAAANHSGGPVGYFLDVSGAGAPAPIGMNTAPGSTQPSGSISTTLAVSPNFGAPDDCSAFASGTFTGQMAIVHFVIGPCNTDALAAHALAAGAAQVLIVSSTDDYLNSGATQALPVFTTTSVQGDALVTFVNSNPGAAAAISYPADTRLPATADSLASFSLIGPANFDVIKPDVQAPGISILAAFSNANPSDPSSGPDVIGFDDGTSMATPHVTGSAALLLGLHKDWTPMEVKSALMMTAKEVGLTKSDHLTPSDFYDRGSGRVQVDIAAEAGLVLNETGQNFLNADPAKGGDPKKLNLASMQNTNCVTVTGPHTGVPTCTFTRELHSTLGSAAMWSASLVNLGGTVTPSSFSVNAHSTTMVSITVDASGYDSDGTSHFGELVLTPADSQGPQLHLPIAVALQPPSITTSPTELSIVMPHGKPTKDIALLVQNTGGPTLNVTTTNDNTSPLGTYVVVDQPSQGYYGDYSGYFSFLTYNPLQGIYVAEDFETIAPSTDLTKLYFPGFSLGSPLIARREVHFEIYGDNGGEPNGNPETVAPSYSWNFVATIGTTDGLGIANSTLSLDLAAAGAPATALPPGRHWITVYVKRPTFYYDRWAWFESTTTFGYNSHAINPLGAFGIGTEWIDMTNPAYGNAFPGMAMHIEAQVKCGADWLSATPPNLALSAVTGATVTVTADSKKFSVSGPGSASAFLCLDSNDVKFPILAVPVTATQN